MSTVQTNLENMFVKGESLNVESKENVSITGDRITFKGGWCFLSGSNIEYNGHMGVLVGKNLKYYGDHVVVIGRDIHGSGKGDWILDDYSINI